MLPTFVIGLREGVEAALIVGIIAAFLRQDPRGRGALKFMWVGVGAAIGLCVAAGVALEILNQDLPQREQEGLETIIALLAVGAVTFMIVWMRKHARTIGKDLRSSAEGALAAGTTGALVGMAFFAVIREGLETVVFLLAAFQSATNPTTAGFGALLGVLVAVAIGFGDLPRRREVQPHALLPHHRHRARLRRRGPRRQRAAHRPRGRLAERRPGARLRPRLARRARHVDGLAADRHARPAAVPGRHRGRRLRGVRRADAAVPARPRRAALARQAAAPCSPPRRRSCSCSSPRCCSPPAATPTTRPAGTKKVAVTLTDAGCEPATIKADAGPTTFVVTNGGTSRVSEFEILDGGEDHRRAREHRRRPVRRLHADAAAGQLHDGLPGRQDRRDRPADRRRQRRRDDVGRQPQGRRDRLPVLRQGAVGRADQARDGVRGGGQGRRRREGQGAVRRRALPLRGDRAGRRELRRPRSRDRRARQRRRQGRRVDRLSSHRAGAVEATTRRRA